MPKPGSVAIVGATELVSPEGVFPELSQLGLHAKAAIGAMKLSRHHAEMGGRHRVGGCSFMLHVRHAAAAIEAGCARPC
jgi:hypothetical protein